MLCVRMVAAMGRKTREVSSPTVEPVWPSKATGGRESGRAREWAGERVGGRGCVGVMLPSQKCDGVVLAQSGMGMGGGGIFRCLGCTSESTPCHGTHLFRR